MTEHDLSTQIIKMEKDLELLHEEKYGADGQIAWEAARFHIFHHLLKAMSIYGVAHKSENLHKGLFGRVVKGIKRYGAIIYRNPFLAPRNREYCIIGHSRRKKNEDGIYEDIYTDRVVRILGMDNCIQMENPHDGSHLRPTMNKNVFYLEKLVLLRKILARKIRIPNSVSALSDDIRDYVERTNLGIPDDLFENLLKRHYLRVQIQKEVALRLFKWLGIKKLLIVCHYNKEGYVLAAKEMHLPVIEFQHGAFGHDHAGYSFAKGDRKMTFADYFFVFGDFWKDVTNLPIQYEKIFSIGFPYFSEMRKKYSLVKEKKILFISQGIIGRDLSLFAVELERIIGKEYQIVFKLHPGEYADWENDYKELYDAFLDDKIVVPLDKTMSIYDFLDKAEWQIGVSSTALFEGIGFGCKTVLVDLPSVKNMDNLLDKYPVQLVSSPGEIDWNQEQGEVNCDDFFIADWRTKLASALTDIS